MSENNSVGEHPLERELGSLLKEPITLGERVDYIIDENRRLGVENQILKIWIVELFANDGFDGGCYDANKLRIAHDRLKEILDKSIRT